MKVKKLVIVCLMSLVFCLTICSRTLEIINIKKRVNYDYAIADDSSILDSYASNINYYDNFRVAYYDNLTKNFGQNSKGSCGYVALGMLLSFYDTFLNDNIIPEQYDVISDGTDTNIIQRRNSPGVMYEDIWEQDNVEYYNYLSAMADCSLQAKLIELSALKGLCSPENADYGTTACDRKLVLESYFSEVVGYSADKQYTITCLDHDYDYIDYSDDVKDFIIAKIQLGYPVLIGIKGKIGGHACIAYDYDETTDSIYCHMGWGSNTTHITPESRGFEYYKSAMVIEFNIEHSHSNNYVIDGKTYCYCTDEVEIYHKHSYDYTNNGTTHTKTCSCGLTKTESHSYGEYKIYDNTFHIRYCDCGASSKGRHSFITYNGETYCRLCRMPQQSWGIINGIIDMDYEDFLLKLYNETLIE